MKLMIQRWHLRGLFQVSQVLYNLGGNILIGVIVKCVKYLGEIIVKMC